MKRLIPFSSNPKKANVWFAVLNGVNLAFGGFFLYNALTRGMPYIPPGAQRIPADFYTIAMVLVSQVAANPLTVALWGLGVVPAVFALLFYLVPFLRSLRLNRANEAIKRQNLRKLVYARVWADPARVDPSAVESGDAAAQPSDPGTADRVVGELAAWAEGNPESGGVYAFPELSRRKEDIRAARSRIKPEDYALGAAVFDSDGPATP